MKSLFIVLAVLLHSVAFSQINGVAVNIADGDTFTLLTKDKKTIKVRLHGIDCPEKGQPYGNKAKEFTKQYLKGNNVTVNITDTDRYGRIVGWVIINNTQKLNFDLLKAGLAWQYIKYDQTPGMRHLENVARKAKVGLWADKNPIPPWEYRKLQKSK